MVEDARHIVESDYSDAMSKRALQCNQTRQQQMPTLLLSWLKCLLQQHGQYLGDKPPLFLSDMLCLFYLAAAYSSICFAPGSGAKDGHGADAQDDNR
jgi:hypothetical protein